MSALQRREGRTDCAAMAKIAEEELIYGGKMDRQERKYDIFISYRRDGGSIPAKWIADSLKERGYSLFLDIESLRSGPFNEKLFSFIEKANDFILIVPPKGLDRCGDQEDWVRKEIEHAKKHNKNIIPIMLNDFQLPAREELPESLQFLIDLNWLAPSVEYYDAFVDRLESFLISRPEGKAHGKIKRVFAYAAVLAGIVAALLFGMKILIPEGEGGDHSAEASTEQPEGSEHVQDHEQDQADEPVKTENVEIVAETGEWAPDSDEEANLPDNTLMGDEFTLTDGDGQIDYEKAMDHSVFGSNMKRRDIDSITFLSSTENRPENYWDVSLKRNGKVTAWIIKENGDYDLYIAAEGGIYAPISCNRMFTGYTNLKTIEWNKALDTRYTKRMDYLFRDCTSLEKIDISSFDTSSVWSFHGMFFGCTNLSEINFGKIDTRAAEYISCMFRGCSNLTQIDLSSFDTKKVLSMEAMFHGCSKLTEIDLSSFDTNKVNNMGRMFYKCTDLRNIDLSRFNTSEVTDMELMFYRCLEVEELNLDNFDTTKVTTMRNMFRDCSKLRELHIKNFNTRAVTNMTAMFKDCSSLEEIDLSSFKTPKLSGMSQMFDGCRDLRTLDLSGFDTKNVTSFLRLFYDCESLESLDLKTFKTSKVTEMSCMFEGCSSLKSLDVSGFDTRNVSSMLHMFRYCSSLEDLDLSGFDRSSLEDERNMFEGCSAVVTGWDN